MCGDRGKGSASAGPVVGEPTCVQYQHVLYSHQYTTQVYDKYLSFISLESSLFSLGLHNTYVTLNDPRMTDQKIEAEVNRVVEGLFSVLATAGMVPIIRCPKVCVMWGVHVLWGVYVYANMLW